jgi:hypothetical protein
MQVNKRTAIGALSVAALAGSAAGGVSALGHENHGRHSGRTLLQSTLAPTVLSDPPIHFVTRGGAPWVLTRG